MRTIGLGLVRSVRGSAKVWDPARRVPGAHSAYFEFESGVTATCVYSGHDHYETSELVWGFNAGDMDDPDLYAAARRDLRAHDNSAEWETEAARGERYGGDRRQEAGPIRPARPGGGGWIMGGPLIVSYDQADIKFSPNGLLVHGDEKQWEIPLQTPGRDGRDFRLDAFAEAINTGKPLQCDGRWGRATVEVLLAIEESGRERREIQLQHQVAYPV